MKPYTLPPFLSCVLTRGGILRLCVRVFWTPSRCKKKKNFERKNNAVLIPNLKWNERHKVEFVRVYDPDLLSIYLQGKLFHICLLMVLFWSFSLFSRWESAVFPTLHEKLQLFIYYHFLCWCINAISALWFFISFFFFFLYFFPVRCGDPVITITWYVRWGIPECMTIYIYVYC